MSPCLEAALWNADQTDLTGMERLQRFAENWVLLMTVPFGRCMVLLDERELGEQWRLQVRKYKRGIDIRVRKMLTDGIADKSIAPLDVKFAAFFIMGALNSVGRWFKADGADAPEAIAKHFVRYVSDFVGTGAAA